MGKLSKDQRCETCKDWYPEQHERDGFGNCPCLAMGQDLDYSGCRPPLVATWKNFSCVHYKLRPEPKKLNDIGQEL